MELTRDELREIICNYKDEGLTFEKISEILDAEYGIKRDRQSIHGIYKRYMDRLEKDKEKLRSDVDIINVAARNEYFSTIKKQLAYIYGNITDSYIKEAIEKYENDILDIEEEMLDIIKDGIRTGAAKDEIMDYVSYKGIVPTEKIYVRLATRAYKDRIKDVIELNIAQSIKHNGNTSIARELVKEFKLENSVTIIKNKYI